MEIYLVGGAVRDHFLNIPIKEKDWVVVGATQKEMLAAGYQQVGKDFPVFLHPKTKEEYALARKERKVAKGYHGFEFDVTASVTLEEDLLRRDLTINAIAQNELGKIIDPYHGVEDLKNKILRHVSPAFVEDPVRILRVARFAARFSDFTVAEQTNELMKKMVQDGEVNALVAERVWKEFEKAMSEVAPWRFIEVLSDCGALPILFPIFDDKKIEVITCLKKISELTSDAFERIVLMMQSTNSLEAAEYLCARYRAPKPIFEMVKLVMQFKPVNGANEILNLLTSLDAFRREDRFKLFLKIGKTDQSNIEYLDGLLSAFNHIDKIALPNHFLSENHGKAIGEYIYKQRLEKLISFLTHHAFLS
ncbi:MAG: multifunctional CCA tRNA nucleotidyl transferase/2'3'-cyclic phosphodiesterase/2'nucleotidase/phosphatase [Pseudomonadota bacterium]